MLRTVVHIIRKTVAVRVRPDTMLGHKDIITSSAGQGRLIGLARAKVRCSLEISRHQAIASAIGGYTIPSVLSCPTGSFHPQQRAVRIILGDKDINISSTGQGRLIGLAKAKDRCSLELSCHQAVVSAIGSCTNSVILICSAGSFGPQQRSVRVILGDKNICTSSAGQGRLIGLAWAKNRCSSENSRHQAVAGAIAGYAKSFIRRYCSSGSFRPE